MLQSLRKSGSVAAAALAGGFLLLPAAALGQGKSFAASGNTSNSASARSASSSIPPVRAFAVSVRDGILTVDGMVGKAGMNYNIHSGFLYFTIPGVGTAIVAQTRFMNAAPQQDAFKGNELTIHMQGHTVELTNSGPLVAAGKGGSEAWVAFDPLYGANIRFPEMGFGDSTQRPYAWPGSKALPKKADANALVTPPPLPKSVQPKPEIASSYTVTIPPPVPDIKDDPK